MAKHSITSDKSRLCGMTQEEVDSYMKEKNIKVSVMMELGYDKDGDWAEVITDDEGYQTGFGDDCVKIVKQWGFSSPNGFHTFDFQVDDEVLVQYMTVLFHKLMDEYDVPWVHAEALAYGYVTSDLSVPYVPVDKRVTGCLPRGLLGTLEQELSEEEQSKVKKLLLNCIRTAQCNPSNKCFSWCFDNFIPDSEDIHLDIDEDDEFTYRRHRIDTFEENEDD